MEKRIRLKVIEMSPLTEVEKKEMKENREKKNKENYGRFSDPMMTYDSSESDNYEFHNMLTVELTHEQWDAIRAAVLGIYAKKTPQEITNH